MSGFLINSNVSLQFKPGSFGASVDEETGLQLPVRMYMCAQNMGWQNAEQFFLGTLDFPEIIQEEFGWTAEECKQASDELRELLRGYLPDEVVDSFEIEQHGMGAEAPLVTDKLLEYSINRAFGMVVSELRLITSRQDLIEVKRKILVSELTSSIAQFILGQSGHVSGFEKWSDKDLEDAIDDVGGKEKLYAEIQRLASAWNSTVEGDSVIFTVAKPVRSGK